MILRVEEPDPVTLEGASPLVTPEGVVADKLTVPTNPFSPVIMMVDVPDVPATIPTGVEALILKSAAAPTCTDMLAE